jgi:hypothetical protein
VTFQERLEKVMVGGNLRVADLARIFGRRHSTVRGWVVDGREPSGTPADIRELFIALASVETAIRKKRLSARASRSEKAAFVASRF